MEDREEEPERKKGFREERGKHFFVVFVYCLHVFLCFHISICIFLLCEWVVSSYY